jgi:hypothetical protein
LATDAALFGADLTDLAEKAVEAVGDAFLNLKKIALECPNLRSGKTLVIWAKSHALKECMAANIRARNAVEKARDQCQQAKLASSEAEYQSLIRQVSEAFDTAAGALDIVRTFYFEMQDELATIDICNQPIEAPADNLLSLEGQSAVADMATFSVEMSTTAVEKATEAFSELRERAMECGDSIAGAQAIYDRARETLIASKKAKGQAARKARKSRSLSRQARAAKSEQKLIQRAKMAEQLATEAFIAAERARYSYFIIRDELERLVCNETPALSPAAAPNTRPEDEQSPPVPEPEGEETRPEDEQSPPVPEPEGEETPLKQWLVKFMKMLYDRIPEALNEFPESETCTLEGMTIYIWIDALERPEEEMWLVTKEVCDILDYLPT